MFKCVLEYAHHYPGAAGAENVFGFFFGFGFPDPVFFRGGEFFKKKPDSHPEDTVCMLGNTKLGSQRYSRILDFNVQIFGRE